MWVASGWGLLFLGGRDKKKKKRVNTGMAYQSEIISNSVVRRRRGGSRGRRGDRGEVIGIQQDANLFVTEIHEPGLLEEGIGIFAVGDRTTGLTGGGVEVLPELAEGGGFLGGTVGVVAARSPVDFDEFAEAAGCDVPIRFIVSERVFSFPFPSFFISPFDLFLEGMSRAGGKILTFVISGRKQSSQVYTHTALQHGRVENDRSPPANCRWRGS